MTRDWNVLHWLPANRMFLRVFSLFGGLLLAMTLIYGALIIPLQRDSLLKVMYSQASTVSRSIIQACSDAMLTDDFGFIVEHNLQVLQSNKSIESVVIVPKRGVAVHIVPGGWNMQETKKGGLPDANVEKESYGVVKSAGGKSFYRYVAPIRFSGVGWGTIQIDFNTNEYEANIAEMYRQLFYISILAVLAILPVGYLFTLWLTRPIATISAAASRVAMGDLGAHVSIVRKDEIGQLSKSFNQMVDALQDSRNVLQNYNLELERKVAERTSELDELNRTLDQRVRDEIAKRKEQENLLIHQSRLAAMGEMIGAIAHQWRQPLNALSLVLQNMLMQHRMGQLTDESMNRMEAKASQLVDRMSFTIDEFRNFFKPGKHPELFNLALAVKSAADIMEGVFKNHNIRLEIECDDKIELFGLAGEFSQVVLNLLSNAKDAIIESNQRGGYVHVRARQFENRLLVDVEDNGGGIEPAILNKVFEPYFSTKDEGKGSGIGLYMSKMIVENSLKGRLEVANAAEGARFTINLPLAGAS
ncbi:MAG: ATP-binding protein [Parasulfuritortus sp.]|nr:ATP-binding protein [Parasulfuritortus sp.]